MNYLKTMVAGEDIFTVVPTALSAQECWTPGERSVSDVAIPGQHATVQDHELWATGVLSMFGTASEPSPEILPNFTFSTDVGSIAENGADSAAQYSSGWSSDFEEVSCSSPFPETWPAGIDDQLMPQFDDVGDDFDLTMSLEDVPPCHIEVLVKEYPLANRLMHPVDESQPAETVLRSHFLPRSLPQPSCSSSEENWLVNNPEESFGKIQNKDGSLKFEFDQLHPNDLCPRFNALEDSDEEWNVEEPERPLHLVDEELYGPFTQVPLDSIKLVPYNRDVDYFKGSFKLSEFLNMFGGK